MKNERGVTLTSLMVYIVAMALIIITIMNITRYFNKNVEYVEDKTKYGQEYLKFTEEITKEINTTGNIVLKCGEEKNLETDNVEQKYIIFSKTYNQYTFKGNAIYKNKSKIAENIKECTFTCEENNNVITIKLTMEDDKIYNNTYKVVNY